MNHTNLTDAIGQLAAAAGYGFHTADERYMSQTITSYPVMWLVEREAAYARLEGDVVELFTALSKADVVVAVEKLTVRPQTRTFTNHGEVAVTATADVITFF